ncbi:TetR/AcrR family transcriptional regulator [Ottowia thiooxydans]|uniref:TetR/AcrR family transcriptional regulator n=1 Tax=Ottowia thiooxydans TaxID=219182 RepID=UPI00042A3F93|nr:TetR/AcrR family transcriptional regulator [Ottowia thiooxydans]
MKIDEHLGARGALVMAAVAEFSRKGFAGARVDEIAKEAGVNKQLVYHYFGSKQDLYEAALEKVYTEIRDRERTLSLDALEPREAMEKLVGFSFDHLQQHPEFIALLADENRHLGSHVKTSKRFRKMHSPLIDMMGTTLARGVRSGVFRPHSDPIQVYISIAALSYFYFSNNHTLSAIFSKSLLTRAALAARRSHVVMFAMHALCIEPLHENSRITC